MFFRFNIEKKKLLTEYFYSHSCEPYHTLLLLLLASSLVRICCGFKLHQPDPKVPVSGPRGECFQ